MLGGGGDVSIPVRGMADDKDPMDPQSWFAEPGVCGSCIAWKSDDPRPGEEVAAGSCRLRAELPRVPATLRKCDLYKARGQFVYQPTASSGSTRRKRSGAAKVMKRSEEGQLVQVRAPVAPRESAGPKMPIERPPSPREVDVGTDDAKELRRVMVALFRNERSTSREMAGRFEGGKTEVTNGSRTTKRIDNERFFGMLESMRSSLEELEDAIVRSDPLLPLVPELTGYLRRVQGSFTTFNILYAKRDDYFSGKE